MEKIKQEVPVPFKPQINQVYADSSAAKQASMSEHRSVGEFVNCMQQWNEKKQSNQQMLLKQQEQMEKS